MNQSTDLRLALERDKVVSLSLREPIEVETVTIVRAAVAMMRNKRLGSAIMVELGKPIGIFTERSVLDVLIHDASLDNLPVKHFADTNFRQVKLSDPISLVWDAILKDGLRFICVTDDDGKLVGLTGQRGLAEYVSEYFPQQVVVQRLGTKPWMAEREGA